MCNMSTKSLITIINNIHNNFMLLALLQSDYTYTVDGCPTSSAYTRIVAHHPSRVIKVRWVGETSHATPTYRRRILSVIYDTAKTPLSNVSLRPSKTAFWCRKGKLIVDHNKYRAWVQLYTLRCKLFIGLISFWLESVGNGQIQLVPIYLSFEYIYS